MTRYRWTICALLFFATTVNYLDRQLFSVLVPFFEDDLRLGPTDLALINVSFLLAYGFGMIFVGQFVDRVGTRRGLGMSFLVWNIASVAHALVTSLTGFMGIRFLLGLGEAGNFPAVTKTVAEWFPKKERAVSFGWVNCGTNIGAILAPVLGVQFATIAGWRACFLVLGGIGFIWIFFWLRSYRPAEEHPRVSEDELAHIRSDPPETIERVSYSELFGMRPVYAIAAVKFFTEAPWWFYLTWLPKFLVDQFKLTPTFMAFAVPVVFLIADFGAVGGGWLSSHLLKKGWEVGAARKTAMLVCALCALPVMAVGKLVDTPSVLGIPSIYFAIGIISLAAAAHQGWSSSVYTLVSDTLPRSAVAMTVGVITAVGVVGGSIFQLYVGQSVKQSGSYAIPFILASGLYLVGLLAFHLILPRVEPHVPRRKVHLSLAFVVGIGLLVALAFIQYSLNKPPYASLGDYFQKRPAELKIASTLPREGPAAKVGWMDARWYIWAGKVELVKFDRDGRPILESKGDKASKYEGPKADQIAGLTNP